MAKLPVAVMQVTPHGAYNYPRARRNHHGIDLAGKAGTLVYAPEDLVVLAVRRGARVERSASPLAAGVGLRGYHPAAVLALGRSGVVHVLGHLDDAGPLPAPGQSITEGAIVGQIGAKVNHVHWEVRDGQRYPWPRARRGADTFDPIAWMRGVLAPSTSATPRPVRVSDVELGGWIGLGLVVIAMGYLSGHARRNRRAD